MKNKFAKNKDLRYPGNKLTVVVKFFFTVIYAWSCFFFGGITIINFFFYKPEYSHLASGFLIGCTFITIGFIMVYFRLFILQLPFIAVGGAIYLVNAGELIDNAARMKAVFKPSFELRHLPVIAMITLSVIIAIIQIWRLISLKSAEKEEYNNRPSGSILD